METFPLTLLRAFPYNTCPSLTKTLQIEDVKYVRVSFLKRVEDLAKPLHEDEDAFLPF